MKFIGNKIIAFLLIFIFTISTLPITAYAVDIKNVKVGFFQFDGYHMINEKTGERSGYGYDILQHMIGYTSWQYEYVGYDKGWNDMLTMLENGEIDILTSAQKTPEREALFDFSTKSIGSSSTILTTKAGNNKLITNNYESWNGIKVGMLNGNSRNQSFFDWANQNNFQFKAVYYENINDLTHALQTTEEVDAILTSNLRYIANEWIIAEFDPSPFYIMVQKGNTEFLNEINKVLDLLYSDEPWLNFLLDSEYYTPQSGNEIFYTTEEREYIEKMKDTTFTAILNPDRPPYSYFSNGEAKGIFADVAKEIIERTGLNIEIIAPSSRAEYRQLISEGKVDIQFDARNNYTEAEAAGYRLTNSYFSPTISILRSKENNKFSTVALLEQADITKEYFEHFGEEYADVFYYDSLEDVINAVSSGKQDFTLLYSLAGEKAIHDNLRNNLVVEKIYKKNTDFSVAVNIQEGPLLYSIINKTVDSIDDNFASTSILKNTTYPEKAFSFLRLVYDYPMALLVFAFLVFLVILSVSIAMLSQKKRKIEMKHTLQLTDALKRAETADASKSLFLSQMSHEIRTPLNSIIGFLELSKDATLEKVREYHINCDNAAKHLLSIVNDVLDMSAIEAGKMKIASAPFNLKDLISSISSTYIPICEKKNIDFNIKLSGEIDEIIVGDKMRFNQILLNILSNAVKFTEKGFIRLSISQTIVAEGNVYLTIKITDSGCGMSPELQSRLFSPFEQENAKTAQKFGGSGLGLSITKNLVSLMKGAIVAESNLGEGSTFTINLPFERSSEKFEYHSRNLNFKDLHVLVVDDDDDDCRYIASILSHMNINSHCVNGGFEALDEIERTIHTENEYNVCIIDVRMPDIDGIETSKMIRERYGKDVIVIVISAFQHYYNDTILIESGADTFIPKPLFQSSLYDLFVNLTDGHSVVAEKTQQGLTDFSGKRILLVEDNQLNRMIATGLLGKQGIVCDVAEDGQIGYEKFINSAQGYYDAILMDIHMPNMNGYESTHAIRNSNHPDSSSIGIIAFTANAFQEEISKALAAGMNAHVPKPIDMPALDKALQQVFNKQ